MKNDDFQNKALSRDEDTIRSMFSREADHYDFLNHVLSFGLDKGWRKALADRSNYLQYGDNPQILDLCCGTGDVALEFAQRDDFKGKISGIDFAKPMIDIAKNKAAKLNVSNKVDFQLGNALKLNFDDSSFHILTIAFGLRNLSYLDTGLSEMRRVLKPHGRVLSLEFFRPEPGLSRTLSNWYVSCIIPIVGRVVSGRWGAYDYLPSSREKFLSAKEFKHKLESRGFNNVQYNHFLFRITTLHISEKL